MRVDSLGRRMAPDLDSHIHAATVENAADLARFGLDLEAAATRLEQTPDALEKLLYRHDREDVLAHLAANRPSPIRQEATA